MRADLFVAEASRAMRTAMEHHNGDGCVDFAGAVKIAVELMDQAAGSARDDAFAEAGRDLQALIVAFSNDDPIEKRRKVQALLARMAAQMKGEGVPLRERLAMARAGGLGDAVLVFQRHAAERGHAGSTTIALAAAECAALIEGEAPRG